MDGDGFLKKIVKKVGRVVTSKSKTTRGVLKVALPIAGGVMLGASAAAIFGARALGQNSEQSTEEPGAYGIEQGDPNALYQSWYNQGLADAARAAGAAAGTGAAATACQAVGVLLGGGG